MKILVFGNPLVKEDALALQIMPQLQELFPEIEFKEFDPTESLENEGEHLKILDVAKGIDKITVLDDLNHLQLDKVYSMHDFDLGYSLKLLKKMGFIKTVKILCLPMNFPEEEAINQSQLILRKWVAQDIQGS